MERLNSFKQNVQSLDARISSSKGAQVQKIYSTAYALCLELRFPGESCRLWIGRGGPVEGPLFPGPKCPSAYRIKDRFLELQRKMLKGFRLIHAKYVESGHFLIHAKSRDVDVQCLYTWSIGKLYFSIVEEKAGRIKAFSPWLDQRWKPVEGGIDDVIKLHQIELKSDIRNPINSQKIFPSNIQLKKVLNNKKKFLKRKKENIRKDLMKVMLADEIQEWAMTLSEGDLMSRVVEFKGVKIKLHTADTFYKKRDLIFQKAKSYRYAQDLQSKRLEDTENELALILDEDTKYELITDNIKSQTRPVLPVWSQKNDSIQKMPSHSPLKGAIFYEGENIKVAVGQNAHANDGLRTKWAHKNDYWFHLEDQVSAHGFLRMKNEVPFTIELFEVVACSLRENSKEKPDEIDLLYTRVKYLKSIKGKPGLVKYTNEKRIRVRYREDWKEILANL